MTLKHNWIQHAAHKKYGCRCVLRDFKSLEVVRLDAGSIKALFWKYFFSLLLSIPRSSLVLHFSVGILVIFTLIWFKVDIKWRKKLEQNSYSLYLCTKNKKDEVEQNISFSTKIIYIFLLSSCPSSQLQEFWAVQHQINASYIQQWVCPYLGSSWFPWSVCQGGLVGLVLGSSLSFPRTARESILDQIWCGEGEQEGREGTGPIFFTSKMGVGLLVNGSLEPPFICTCKSLRFWENRDEPSALFLQESFIRLVLSRTQRVRGDCVGWYKHPHGWAFWPGSSKLTDWNFQTCIEDKTRIFTCQ